ncbi:MAG TPA: hypothetical protein VLK84_04385 [Longimicrobium sp.]|nr:hypothetical protein [Longimicrobium sp.]
MHAHSFATQERTLAPSQILRGVAVSCAPVAGTKASSITRSSSVRPAKRRLDSWYPCPGMGFSGLDKDVDWGNLVGGGPV